MLSVLFYRTVNGECPVEEFLDRLTAKEAKKITWVLRLIESLPMVPRQYFKKLAGAEAIWEVRVESGRNTFRVLGFIDEGSFVVLTNAFAKKSQKTPSSEIELAENRRRDHLSRGKK